jgi:phage terminase large subunit-like protein
MKRRNDPVREELIQYCHDIIDGNIIACKKHKWACMRFLRDLERENTEEFPYLFNPQIKLDTGEVDENGKPIIEKYYPADRYFEWMRLFKHSKGELEGQFKEPNSYEKFVYGNIYGWIHRETKRRRFKRSYEQLARKTAKSQDKAIQVLYEISAFGEKRAEAYVAASNKSQTRYVWGEAKWLVENTEAIRDKFVIKFDQELLSVIIRHKKSGGFFARLSKDDKKIGDGSNPSFWVLDEYHLQETTEYYDIGVSGMKTRAQALLSIITTAGFELNNPCYRVEYDYISKLLNPDIDVENDQYFAIVCELEVDEEGNLIDDIKDESVWPKANPLVACSEIIKDSMRTDLKEALDKPEKMRDTLTKTFNIWINQRAAGYMNLDKWKSCIVIIKTRPFPDIKGMRAFLGLDLSSRLDITSLSADIPLPDDCYAVLHHSFMPIEMMEYKMKTDSVRYDLWRERGLVTITEGAEVDYHFVLDYLVYLFDEYKWPKDTSEVCFDQAMATWLEHEIIERGFKALAVPQSYTGLSEATKDFRNKVYNQKVIHDDPMLTWAVSNAVIRSGPSGNIMLDKNKVKQRIDPLASLITAHTRAMIREKPKQSVYETKSSFKL